jgi:hypothetical protein
MNPMKSQINGRAMNICEKMTKEETKAPKMMPAAMQKRRCHNCLSSAFGRVETHIHDPMPKTTQAIMNTGA